jgi:hypothetical protein
VVFLRLNRVGAGGNVIVVTIVRESARASWCRCDGLRRKQATPREDRAQFVEERRRSFYGVVRFSHIIDVLLAMSISDVW